MSEESGTRQAREELERGGGRERARARSKDNGRVRYTDQYLPGGTQYQQQTGTACSRRKYLTGPHIQKHLSLVDFSAGPLLHICTLVSLHCKRSQIDGLDGVIAPRPEAAGAAQDYEVLGDWSVLGKAGLLLDQRQAQDGLAACCLACVLYEHGNIGNRRYEGHKKDYSAKTKDERRNSNQHGQNETALWRIAKARKVRPSGQSPQAEARSGDNVINPAC